MPLGTEKSQMGSAGYATATTLPVKLTSSWWSLTGGIASFV